MFLDYVLLLQIPNLPKLDNYDNILNDNFKSEESEVDDYELNENLNFDFDFN